MGKNIRDHAKNFKEKDVRSMRREDLNDEEKGEYDRLKKAASQYQNMNEDQLLNELMRRVEAGKKDGSLSNADIDRFAAQAAPMLTPEQRKKLDALIRMIK